ncbi:1,4-dihydroxy-2-naphthoate octaprenyltransferase [Croceitalea rosinachiae]|uniref:1,4-dihydroxy-2-naphthoate octaprenyltransferase n=1 Tax=Croceitalea rosinachiae TaxID=3075596 RepID=A0ABU3AE35_9FLAO|nr:1,4-dihydroxy-2-naphthoate octaprenyltransferase [Croceitalea sp. F388]MDT0607363.1 1,4-dihydroxy-2-naphthoate octaprenyltransferase [Croceitalea sp. F388]
MGKIKAWISAARLRTLPLSVSGILLGTALANYAGFSDGLIFSLAIATTITFQITSNFANDYGDGIKGTDNEQRIGPKRALQSGLLTKRELKLGIIICAAISFCLTVFLVYISFGPEKIGYILLFLVLGILSIWASLRYTMGDSPYGYRGLGDVFVFLFFGILSVLGTKFLYAKQINSLDFLPAIAVGFLCVGVLNLNNLRDFESDKHHSKNTLIVKIGFEKGKKYHYTLLFLAFLSFTMYTFFNFKSLVSSMYLLFFVPIFFHVLKVLRTSEPKLLDPELKKLALSTFFTALAFYFTINYFS